MNKTKPIIPDFLKEYFENIEIMPDRKIIKKNKCINTTDPFIKLLNHIEKNLHVFG